MAAMRCDSKNRSFGLPGAAGALQDSLTSRRESVLMVHIVVGAVANRFDSGYDESHRA
jgi:hypothetical protein